MAYLRTFRGEWATIRYFECDRCKEEISEMHPRYEDRENDHDLCWHCAFIEGKLTEEQFLKHCGIYLKGIRAAVRNGEIIFYFGKPPWERTDREERNSPEYREWRTKVFERDNYTCQHCGQIGGELNAHHIKSFAKHKELRFDVNNGITLCVECHKMVHKKRKKLKKAKGRS